MATIMTFVLLIAAICASIYWLREAKLLSVEALQQKQQHTSRIFGLDFTYCALSSFVMLLPLNDDESLKEKELQDKSFEKAVKAMIDSGFSEVLGEY